MESVPDLVFLETSKREAERERERAAELPDLGGDVLPGEVPQVLGERGIGSAHVDDEPERRLDILVVFELRHYLAQLQARLL